MKIRFPTYNFRFKKAGDQTLIFDIIRKKFVKTTPEEIVRQHFIHYFIHEKKVPKGLISIEKSLHLNQLQKRYDLVIFNQAGQPVLILECKAPDIRITQKAFDQVARYNMVLQVKYLVVSNGSECYCCQLDLEKGEYMFLEDIPDYDQLS